MSQPKKYCITIDLEMLEGAETQAKQTLMALAQACAEEMACFELPGFRVADLRVGNGKPPSRDTHVFKSRPLTQRDR